MGAFSIDMEDWLMTASRGCLTPRYKQGEKLDAKDNIFCVRPALKLTA